MKIVSIMYNNIIPKLCAQFKVKWTLNLPQGFQIIR